MTKYSIISTLTPEMAEALDKYAKKFKLNGRPAAVKRIVRYHLELRDLARGTDTNILIKNTGNIKKNEVKEQ